MKFYGSLCRPCKLEYARSRRGLAVTIHKSMVQRSKKRGHALPDFSREALQVWLDKQPSFERLYEEWVIGGYESDKKPSVDRIDKYKTYTFGNMQLISWGANNRKGYREKERKVYQYTLEGKLLRGFESVNEALQYLGKKTGHISAVARGERNKAFGYKWSYNG